MIIVALLTIFSHSVEYSGFFYLLYPGNIVSQVITGGHGGTLLQERMALISSFILNVLVYFLIIFSIHAVVRAIHAADPSSK